MLWTSVTYLGVQALSAVSTELFSIYPSYYILDNATAVGGGGQFLARFLPNQPYSSS